MKAKFIQIFKLFKESCNFKKIISVVMACITYFTFCELWVLPAYNLLSWFIFIAIITLFLKTDFSNKILNKEILCLSIIFSILSVFGSIVYDNIDNYSVSIFRTFLTFKQLWNCLGIFNMVFVLLTNIIPRLYNWSIKINYGVSKHSIKVFIFSFLFIIACWLPFFLTFYPGSLSPDSFCDIGTIMNNFSQVSDHHPVFHLLFVAVPFKIGYSIFNNANAAVALSTIVQMITMALIFSNCIEFLTKRNVNKIIILLLFVYYGILPMHGYYSVTMWKDVVFSGVLLLLTKEMIKLVENVNKKNFRFRHLLSFIFTSIVCVFFRNNAIYMYMFLAVTTLIILRKRFKILFGAFLIVFSTYYFVKGPVFNYFKVQPSGSAEYIGMPLQQIGRMAAKQVSFEKEQVKLLDKLIPFDIIGEAYNPRVSDGIKFNKNYNPSVFDENKKEYLFLWMTLVKEHPSVALEAYACSTLGYWYPGVMYWSVANDVYTNDYNIYRKNLASEDSKELLLRLEDRNLPILNIEWSIGLCFWIILIFSIISVKKNGVYGILPYLPVIGIWITMMVASPVFGEFRYVYGAFTTLPMLLICPYLSLKRKK